MNERCEKSYITGDTVFIDDSVVRRVRRKAIKMKGQLFLHFVGVSYQKCLKELGIWNEKGPDV